METQKKKYQVSTGGPDVMVRPFLFEGRRHLPKPIATVEDGEILDVIGEVQCRMGGFLNWLKIELMVEDVLEEGYIAKMYAKPLEA